MLKYGFVKNSFPFAQDWNRIIIGDKDEIRAIYKALWRNGIKHDFYPVFLDYAVFSAHKSIYALEIQRTSPYATEYSVMSSDTVLRGLLEGWIVLD